MYFADAISTAVNIAFWLSTVCIYLVSYALGPYVTASKPIKKSRCADIPLLKYNYSKIILWWSLVVNMKLFVVVVILGQGCEKSLVGGGKSHLND